MTNAEIDIRLRILADYIPKHAQKRYGWTGNEPPDREIKPGVELELINMQLMMISAMLGEIAKRLGEGNNTRGGIGA